MKLNKREFLQVAAAGAALLGDQAPGETVKELQRCIQMLGLNGGIINSHINGEYLDDAKYWPVLEAFEAPSRRSTSTRATRHPGSKDL